MNITTALHDSRFFLPWFRDVKTWKPWETYLRALFGLPIEGEEDKRLFQEATGLTEPPTSPAVGGSKKDTKKGNRGVGRDKAEVLKRSWVFSSLIS